MPLGCQNVCQRSLCVIKLCVIEVAADAVHMGEHWTVNYTTGGGCVQDLCQWRELLEKKGPLYGYIPYSSKM